MNTFTVKSVAKFLIVLLFFPLCLNAQNEEVKPLFKGDTAGRYGVYVAIDAKVTQLDGWFGGFILGARSGIVFNNVFSIGGAGYGLIPTKKITCPIPEHENEKNNYLTGGYGGLFFEYTLLPNRSVHFIANAFMGCGSITYIKGYDNNNIEDINKSFNHPSSFVVVLEPGIGVEINTSKLFKMSLGVSYRYAPNFKLQYNGNNIVPKTAFNGLSLNLMFKFGNFTEKPYIPPPPIVEPPVIPPVNIPPVKINR